MTTSHATFTSASAPAGPGGGAIALIHVRAATADALEAALRSIGVTAPAIGGARVRRIAAVDEGLVARWSATTATLMPHASPVVLERIEHALCAAGVAPAEHCAPEAADEFEALVSGALARAQSPRAIDLLLPQADRWRCWAASPGASRDDAEAALRVSAELDRLLDPPTVVALGPTNIGKSTLLNAFARETLAIVADEPGVTRDHVGALVDLDGLVVRWIDTPGLRNDAPETERTAQRIALDAADDADLLVLCADARTTFPSAQARTGDAIRLGLRADLGATPGADLGVCALDPDSLRCAAAGIRRALLTDEALAWTGLWAFHPTLRERLALI